MQRSKMEKGPRDDLQRKNNTHSISSTVLANNVMKFRLKGSVSDPLNLEGCPSEQSIQDPPSLVSSPSLQESRPPLPLYLRKDPLNIQGKSRKRLPSRDTLRTKAGMRRKARYARRSTSNPDGGQDKSKATPKTSSKFSYGNYDRYYGYRNRSVHKEDLRLSLIKLEWIERKRCLDIGCNTGDVTIKIGRDFHPKKIIGIDIDPKLVQMAWRNLQRELLPTAAPDGRQFPQSFAISHVPPAPLFPSSAQSEDGHCSKCHSEEKFPDNVHFRHCNYMLKEAVPADDVYDTILALSVTKWIHLNWGDEGIKYFFKKVYSQLRPGGYFILEPQPFQSYSKKKNLTPEILENYRSISFFPKDFHDYLMSTEVGFDGHKLLGTPDNHSKGFQRPLHLYSKSKDQPLATATEESLETMDK